MKLQNHIDSLIALESIDRRGSFAAAADELHRATSSITYAIQKLESSLGVSLFDRNGHKAKLTSAGKELLREGRLLLDNINKIEQNVKLIAGGWEAEIRIAINDIVSIQEILNILDEFYRTVQSSTRIRILSETFQGPWDALVSGRADLALGVAGDGINASNFQLKLLDEINFIFVVAPNHPLASFEDPIPKEIVRQYRAVAAADSSRVLPAKTFGLFSSQPVLTVPDQHTKYLAITQGIAVGHLPYSMIQHDLELGKLIRKNIENDNITHHNLYYAWPTRQQGKALNWFLNFIENNKTQIHWLHSQQNK